MGLLIAALTGWDLMIALASAGAFIVGFGAVLWAAIYFGSRAAWRLLPESRVKRFLFKEYDNRDPGFARTPPWVRARWIKKPQQRTNRINAPAEFIPGERADQPRSGTRQQGPESRR